MPFLRGGELAETLRKLGNAALEFFLYFYGGLSALPYLELIVGLNATKAMTLVLLVAALGFGARLWDDLNKNRRARKAEVLSLTIESNRPFLEPAAHSWAIARVIADIRG